MRAPEIVDELVKANRPTLAIQEPSHRQVSLLSTHVVLASKLEAGLSTLGRTKSSRLKQVRHPFATASMGKNRGNDQHLSGDNLVRFGATYIVRRS